MYKHVYTYVYIHIYSEQALNLQDSVKKWCRGESATHTFLNATVQALCVK